MLQPAAMASVDEGLVRGAVGLFGLLALALSFGRSAWFWRSHGKRPIARPRDARERAWHRGFLATVALLFAICAARIAGPDAYRFCVPLREVETAAGFAVGLTAVICGFALAWVAQSQMGASWRIGIPEERTELVTSGLYSRIRNPIYTGFLTAVAGLAGIAPSVAAVLAFATCAVIVRAWVQIEEEAQERIHGEAFRAYRARTGRFLPPLRT